MEALSTGESYKIEYALMRPNGEERTVFEQADAVEDEQGNVIQLIGVVHDITESKVITNELKQKNSSFKRFITIWMPEYGPLMRKAIK
ncbi:PAS domain-containing protein [Bacillus megaterium]|nr:PAS domain-containing protein [Priestia megaterium]